MGRLNARDCGVGVIFPLCLFGSKTLSRQGYRFENTAITWHKAMPTHKFAQAVEAGKHQDDRDEREGSTSKP